MVSEQESQVVFFETLGIYLEIPQLVVQLYVSMSVSLLRSLCCSVSGFEVKNFAYYVIYIQVCGVPALL